MKRVFYLMLCLMIPAMTASVYAEGTTSIPNGNNQDQTLQQPSVTTTATPVTEKQVPWRNSILLYENIFNPYTLDKSAQLSYNPYYAQSFSFRPRYYLRDDLSFRLRFDLEIELTTSDETDRGHEWVLSDTYFDTVYAPAFLTIPKLKIKVEPNLRMMFPSSKESQGRSQVMTLGPSLTFRREIPLRKGKVLTKLDLTYSFRGTKYFNRYALAQVGDLEGCQNLNRPECQHQGKRNLSWRLNNAFGAKLQILDKLSFGVDLLFYNDLLNDLPEETVDLGVGSTAFVGSTTMNHKASTWAIFEVGYDLFDWLSLSAGTSTFYGQLADDSDYRTPLFNRFTNIYFDVSVPIDPLINQVKTWTRRSKHQNNI